MSFESPIPPEANWKLTINQKSFDKLKVQESFWQIVALSRAVNSLRFVLKALKPFDGDDSPAAWLIRFNSFYFTCALLYEASKTVQHFGKHYRDLQSYKSMMTVINSKAAINLRDSNLGEIRNKLVFHFGCDEIGTQLATLTVDEPIFATGKGDANKDVYFDLADFCVLRSFAGFPASDNEEDMQRTAELMKQSYDLARLFMARADDFIVTVLRSQGWDVVVA